MVSRRAAADRPGWSAWLAEVVADPARTTNLIRQARWAVLAVVLLAAILATTVVVITLGTPGRGHRMARRNLHPRGHRAGRPRPRRPN